MKIYSNKYIFILQLLIPIIIISYFVGNRDINIGTDTFRYVSLYENRLSQIDISFEDLAVIEPIFIAISKILSFLNFQTQSYLFVISFLSFSLLIYSIFLTGKLINFQDPNKQWIFLLITIVLIMISPLTSSLQINILKMGIAIPCFLISMFYFTKRNIIKSILFALISVFTHYSMILFFILILGLKFSKKVLLLIYVFLSLLYLTEYMNNIILLIINQFGNLGSMNYYLDFFNAENPVYQAGVRIDFWIFSTFFVGMTLINTPRYSIEDYFSKLYIIAIFPFLILGFINYSDRLLNLPWLIIPLIISAKLTRIIPNSYYSYAIVYSIFLLSTIFFLFNSNLV